MRRHSLSFLALALSLAAVPAMAQRDFSQVQIKSQKVADGVYMLVGSGGNLGVSVGEDGVFLVDDQFAPLTEKIKAAVAELSDQPIRFVINTHWHGDHTGGNENLGKGGTLIVAHDNVRERMSTDQFMEAFGRTTPASPKAALPVVTFADRVSFHLNGQEIRAYGVDPAHTDGDSVIHFTGSNVIHMGDLFFKDRFPFIDLSSGGSVDGLIAAVERVLEDVGAETKIIPGHGSLAVRADLETYLGMLRATRDAVAKLIAEGKSRDEVIAAEPTAAWNEAWGSGFINGERYVGGLFDSLTQ